jgi:predicted nucleic-acid-binding protein
MLDAGGDFAEGCVLFEAKRAKCDRLATFDKTFATLSGGFASPP